MKTGVKSSGVVCIVLGLALAQSATAQTFKGVSVKAGVKLATIAAGGTSIWGLTVSGKP